MPKSLFKTSPKTIFVGVRIRPDQAHKLDLLGAKLHRNRSEMIRMILNSALCHVSEELKIEN